MNQIEGFIENIYQRAISMDSMDSLDISDNTRKNIDVIVDASENSKAVLTVTVTSLIYKSLHPEQDIRCHQTSIENDYSGRTFDSNHITPFLRSKSFPNMAESGWLTRSLEQKRPYTMDYPGAIKPARLKSAFLELLDEVETQNIDPRDAAVYLFRNLIAQRDAKTIELAKPKNLSIDKIIQVLIQHFDYPYKSRGTSRLPVLALYAVYQNLIRELKRFDGKKLQPLENHNSADKQSGRLGDIDVINDDGIPFEAVEVKYEIPVSSATLERVKEKILPSAVSRYYILSTAEIKKNDLEIINGIISQVKNSHGCQIVVNGIIPSLKYYLRLLENPSSFLVNYVNLLSDDETVKYEHKEVWNKLIAQL